jgi:hypothetical protein
MQSTRLTSGDTRKSILRAIARLEHRVAEAQSEARACRTGISELRAAATAAANHIERA